MSTLTKVIMSFAKPCPCQLCRDAVNYLNCSANEYAKMIFISCADPNCQLMAHGKNLLEAISNWNKLIEKEAAARQWVY